MGGSCSCCGSDGTEEKAFGEEGKDLSEGPITRRSCTDVFCIVIFAVHLVAWFGVTIVGFVDGDPRKLYRPRDFQGDYCGIGEEFGEHLKLVQTMNVTELVDPIMRQVVCSTASSTALQSILSSTEYQDYLCDCCLVPCGDCTGSLGIPDITNPATLKTTIQSSMSRLTDPAQGSALLGPQAAGFAAVSPESLFREMTKYFVPVCYLGTCALDNVNFTSVGRTFKYRPDVDSKFRTSWDALLSQGPTTLRETISENFDFKALPQRLCPYEERYCVPMPGVNFTEAPNDYCVPRLEASVVASLGSSAATVFEGLGSASVTENTSQGFGGLVGQLLSTMDTLLIVTMWSFIIGLIFMIALRFLIGCFVYCSLGLVFVLMVMGGAVAHVRSTQCKGAGLFDSGKQSAMAVTVAATSAAQAAVGGQTCSEATSEADGSDYRGCQTKTVSGYTCQRWDEQGAPHNHSYTPSNYPNSDLSENYCRNPAGGSTIWCITSSTEKRWEECLPIGVITPECSQGYEIDTEYARDALMICAYVVWALGGIWLFLCVCLHSRIRLAIAINKVAAMFVSHHPTVLLVPIVQIVVSCAYTMFWIFCASFLLSQVPSTYTSTESYATWTEAMGDATTPGGCNPKWPAGFAYKSAGDVTLSDDPCSGRYGDTTGITPKCWKCAPPRYVIDPMFAYAFFSYLWNSVLFVAIGQCILACAVGMWFFTKSDQKGKKSPTWAAVKTITRYHLGSLAFGAFIIAVVIFIRYCIKYLEMQASQQKNRVMVYILKVVQCCLWCFEKCLKFLNKNAYIQVALMGTNFCQSAKTAFFLILRNMARFGMLTVLGSVIQVIGCGVIVVGTAMSGYFILQLMHPEASPVMPVFAYLAVSYMVAQLFMTVFGMAVDTSLQCFIIAEEQKLAKDCVPKQLRGLLNGQSSTKKVQPGDADAKGS